MYKQKVIYSHVKQFIQMLGKRGLFMEKKKAIEKFLRTMMLIIMSVVICLGITKSAYAKVSDSTKTAAKKAYQNHMKKTGRSVFYNVGCRQRWIERITGNVWISKSWKHSGVC